MTHSPSSQSTAPPRLDDSSAAPPRLAEGAAVLGIAAVLALLGRSSLKRVVPPVPAEAAAGLRADLAEVTDALSRGGEK